MTSSLNILGREVDRLRSRVETTDMEDVEAVGASEKPESPDIDTKVVALGVKLREQLTGTQT